MRSAADRFLGSRAAGGDFMARLLLIHWKQVDTAERAVREFGLAAGLVDFKICAIDHTWSGLKFTRRRGD
jgi:hypothetical protein